MRILYNMTITYSKAFFVTHFINAKRFPGDDKEEESECVVREETTK